MGYDTVLDSLAFYCVDEYREAFDMDLESCFGAFDSEYGRVGAHRHRIPS